MPVGVAAQPRRFLFVVEGSRVVLRRRYWNGCVQRGSLTSLFRCRGRGPRGSRTLIRLGRACCCFHVLVAKLDHRSPPPAVTTRPSTHGCVLPRHILVGPCLR